MRPIVVKAGGDLLQEDAWREGVARRVADLARTGPVVLVHGGGPQLDHAAATASLPTHRIAGRRITSAALRDQAIATWRGQVSARWVTALTRHGASAVGVAGYEAQLLTAHRRPPVDIVDDQGRTVHVDFGFVGDVRHVDPTVLTCLLPMAVPVITPLAGGPDGILNVNADTVAAAVAVAIGAQRLDLLTRAPGILTDPDDPTSRLEHTDLATLDRLADQRRLLGGMRPKVAAVRSALHGGVGEVRVLDGRCWGTESTGTRIVAA